MRDISWKKKKAEYRLGIKKLKGLVSDPDNVIPTLEKRISPVFRKAVIPYLVHVANFCIGYNGNGVKDSIETVLNIHLGDCAEHNHREAMR